MKNIEIIEGVELLPPKNKQHWEVLTRPAMQFLLELHREFNPQRLQLLQNRVVQQQKINRGVMPDFLPQTRAVREGFWQVAPVPEDLQDRRVEITGPVDRKTIINALNSGANCYMADFEDSHSPTWGGTLDGQINVRDAVRGHISFTSVEGKHYQLNSSPATLLVRPRGWHLPENNVLIDGEPASASLFDFALYFFHNVRYRAMHDSGVYLYLPKIENYLEARLWNDIFVRAQQILDVPLGTIKATVLIEHILAAYQMEEILFELCDHSAGLNCGRWDYLFSYIKKFAAHPDYIVPDRAQVTMTSPMMRAYALSCIRTCHRRGTFAIGGMSAYIPVKTDALANEKAIEQVREDKRREATDGHDGTWVAHPGLVAVAREQFDKVLGDKPNQIDRKREDVRVTAQQLIEAPRGTITEDGLRTNIRVAIRYLDAWLQGTGCVPLYNLMEDAATAEISRSQVWQWIHNPNGILEDGRRVTSDLVRKMIAEEAGKIVQNRGGRSTGRLKEATQLFEELVMSEHLEEFLTLKAYELLEPDQAVVPSSKSIIAPVTEPCELPALLQGAA